MANDYEYLEATVDEIELNTKKVTEIDDSTTYTEEQYPTVEAVKDYVNSHSSQITVDDALSDASENPVQNKIIKSALDGKLDLKGGVMQGVLNMSGNNIINVGQLTFLNNKMLNMNNGRIINLTVPTIPTGATNKKYVDDADALNEKLANKVTTLENADNVKYPTTLAVKNAIEAIPASPATRYKLCVLKANWSNFGFTYSQREDGAYFECGFEIPIGVINDNVYTPKTNPVFPLAYGEDTGYWNIDYALSFGKGSATYLNEQVEVSIPFDKTEAELMEESELASVRISLLMKCDTVEEAQEWAEQFEQMKDVFTKVDFVYETFVEQTVEFIEE